MRIVTKRARRGLLGRNQFVTTIETDNGGVLFTSETYNNHADAVAVGWLVETMHKGHVTRVDATGLGRTAAPGRDR